MATDTDAKVWKVIGELDKAVTVREITLALGSELSEKTIRRSLQRLTRHGFIIAAGKSNHAYQYVQTKSQVNDKSDSSEIIPVEDGLMSVHDFVKYMVERTANPFASRLKQDILTENITDFMRRRMLMVVMSASEPGYTNAALGVRNDLAKIHAEINRISNLLSKFLDSPVWSDHYRDRIGYDTRRLQENDPELFKLTWDFIASQ